MAADTSLASADAETVIVEETGIGKYQVEARVGSASFLIDEPASVGGLGSGPNPYDLLSAALGSCTAMTIRLYAARKAWPLTHVRVKVVHRRDALQAKDSFTRDIYLEGALDEAQRTHLIEIAERCPVHLSLERGSDIITNLAPVIPPMVGEPCTVGEHMKHMDEACAA
jgi:putative redox protein